MRAVIGRWVCVLALLAAGESVALDPYKPFEQYARDSWSDPQGMPDATVAALVQDRVGHVWIGTQQGLARFDGVAIRTFVPENTPALPNRRIEAFWLDRAGRLWIGTFFGVALYDGAAFHSVELRVDGTAATTRIWGFAELADGTLVAATGYGLFRRVDDTRFEHWPLNGTAPVQGVWRGRDGLMVSQPGALLRVADDGSVAERHALPGDAADPVRGFAEYRGAQWAGTVGGLFRRTDGEFARVEWPGVAAPRVLRLYPDAGGSLWIGTDRDLLRLRPDDTIEVVDARAHKIAGARGMLEDREGSLWLGTFGGGAMRLWDGWVDRYTHSDGLADPMTWFVVQWTEGRKLVGTESGLALLDGRRFVPLPAPFATLPRRPVRSILVEGDAVWVGGVSGLYRADSARARLVATRDGVPVGNVTSIHRDPHGELWIASERGPFRYEDGTLVAVPVEPADAARDWRVIRADASGTLYGGSTNGLFRWNGTRFERLPAQYLGRPFSTYSLLPLADGTVVAGGQNPALWFERPDGARSFGIDDGLPPYNGYGLALDRYGMLWVSGAKGAYKVPLTDFEAYARGRIKRLHIEHVLSSSGLVPGAQKAVCCNGGGQPAVTLIGDDVWYPTEDGVVHVPVTGMSRNPVVPEVRIARVRHGGEWQDVLDGARVALPLGARNVDFELSVLSFRDPKSVRVKYQLAGFDPDWRELESASFRRVGYTNLPPGRYTFHVMGSNDAGVWNEVAAELPLVVPPHFHETWVPWAAGTAALLVLLYGAYRWRLGIVHAQRNALERKVRERTAELDAANRALHDASETDALTRLRNRRYLHDHLPTEIAALAHAHAPEGNDGTPGFGFVLTDIDHFKQINDRHGHAAGDAVLRQFAAILKGSVRDGDYAVRWGGEEFLLVLTDQLLGGPPADLVTVGVVEMAVRAPESAPVATLRATP